MQEVVLDRNVRLLDSPGVVFDDDHDADDGAVLLRNCVDVDTVADPVPAVRCLVRRCTRESLMMTYAVPAFPADDADVFLSMVARKLGKVKKGGVPDRNAAARAVLRDWNGGKIPYYTPVPEAAKDDASSSSGGNDAVVVSEFSAEFDARLMDELGKQGGDDDAAVDEMDYVQLAPVRVSKRSEKTARALAEGDDENDVDMGDVKDQSIVDNNDMADAEDYDFGDAE